MNILTGMITQITIKYTYTLIWHLYKQQISSKIQIWMRIAIMIFLNCFGKQYCNTLSWRRKFFFHIYLTEKNLTNQKVRHLFRNWSWLYMYFALKWILVLHKIRLNFFLINRWALTFTYTVESFSVVQIEFVFLSLKIFSNFI